MKRFSGRPDVPIQAPDEKQVRISFSAIGQYMTITERNNKPIGIADLFACAQALSQSALAELVKMEGMTLCKRCGSRVSGAGDQGEGGNHGDGSQKEI